MLLTAFSTDGCLRPMPSPSFEAHACTSFLLLPACLQLSGTADTTNSIQQHLLAIAVIVASYNE
jgi:hypothetical protein